VDTKKGQATNHTDNTDGDRVRSVGGPDSARDPPTRGLNRRHTNSVLSVLSVARLLRVVAAAVV